MSESEYSLISHQTGAIFAMLLDQMIEFKPVWKLIIAIQTAKEHAPTFQSWNIFLDVEKNINRHDPKFAIATRGKVESMLGLLHLRKHSDNIALIKNCRCHDRMQHLLSEPFFHC